MKPPTHNPVEDDPRLLHMSRAYLADLEMGRKPDRQAYLASCPELAEALAECFDGIDLAQTLKPPAPSVAMEYPANPLGDFQILRELGRGGMGVVYEAVQLSLGRRVALKVLPFAAALDAKHLQRFKMEAHAAAQLHHTNIVPVYAVGCERGVHFYAMQIIDGRSLDLVIRNQRGEVSSNPTPASPTPNPSPLLRGEGKKGASTVEFKGEPTRASNMSNSAGPRSGPRRENYRHAARIAAQVADALEYAHDAGVVHRDIKPANLLLDAKGTVWVTDFGLAQVSTDVGLTQTGNLVGTLRYMSPEQAAGARGQVDHRTDVYSLGATLYEMLTLEPIFPGHDRQTILHQILNEEPRPPRQADRSIPVELETILLKALAKSSQDRYATAGEMGADLHRFLDERPILARRPSLVDRSRKWMRRHPSFVGAAVLLLVFGVMGLAVATAMIAHEQALTQAAYDRERQRAEEAEERFRMARRAADDIIQMAEGELADNPLAQNLRKRLLESAASYYQEFIEQRRENPDAQAELAITRDRVKKILDDLAVLQGAGQFFLLNDGAVLDDLGLDGEQRIHLRETLQHQAEQGHESFRAFHRLAPEERRQRFIDLARSTETAVAAILSPPQLRRIRQIALQCQGPMAFRETEIAVALKLTAKQKESIRTIATEVFFQKPDWARAGAAGPDSPAKKPPPKDQWKSAMVKIQALLTEEQKNRWREMTGEEFKGLTSFFPPPGMMGPLPR